MWFKINILILFNVSLFNFGFAQIKFKGHYHHEVIMIGKSIELNKNGTFKEENKGCLLSSKKSGNYKYNGDSLYLIYNIDNYFLKNRSISFQTEMLCFDSLRISINFALDSNTSDYNGVEIFFYDGADSLIALKSIKANSKAADTFLLHNEIRYKIDLKMKTRKREEMESENYVIKESDILDISSTYNYPLFKKYFIKKLSKEELILECEIENKVKTEYVFKR